MEMFEKAARLKLRFASTKGHLTVEDLWDIPLASRQGGVNLDDIARGLHKQLKNDDDVSFVQKERKSDETIQLQFDVVKHVIDVRLAESTKATEARENAEKKQRILGIIADREDDALKSMPLDELKKAVAAL